MLPPKRIEATERRLAAIHEAGHISAASYLNLLNVSGAIWKHREADARCDEKSWVGHTAYFPLRVHGTSVSNLRGDDLKLFSVAGAVSELSWQGATFEETLENESWNDPAAMSDSDWLGCKCAPGNPSPRMIGIIEKAFRLFSRDGGILWPGVLVYARTLIVEARSHAVHPLERVRNAG